ncbi:hypothetical protein HPB51_007170 [Rhipicephalus microplus]|uniref:tRNA synthetases class I catalytic domain-containing protein n=1 Tax=Rhipicephalus microplus TaxID=6941 RepID=A0A9J6DZZ4_RHIMP|nr:hypothetical protein HPB51_007170 [Rhipicephalus microplus]
MAFTCRRLFSGHSLKRAYLTLSKACSHASNPAATTSRGCDTGILLYDPITREKRRFVVDTPGVVKWYSCGPTVYDCTHVGHACSYIRADIVRRILSRFFDLDVVLLMGITDVDDKIINRARDLGVTYETHARKYEREFREDLAKLGVLPPTLFLRVSEHIDAIVAFCSALNDKGFAYAAPDGSLLLRACQVPPVRRVPHARKRGRRRRQGDRQEGRPRLRPVERGEARRAVLGGALGFRSSRLARRMLRHGKHRVRTFPRRPLRWQGPGIPAPLRTNWRRAAATTACPGGSTTWLHTGQVHVCGPDGKPIKMAKSQGNAMPLREFLENHSANVFRMFCLQKAYRADILLSPDMLQGAENSIQGLNDFCGNASAYVRGQVPTASIVARDLYVLLDQTRSNLRDAFADDLDYPKGSVVRVAP